MGISVANQSEPVTVVVNASMPGPVEPPYVNSSRRALAVHVSPRDGRRHHPKLSRSGVTVGLGVTGRWVIPPNPDVHRAISREADVPVTSPQLVTPGRYPSRYQLNGWGW